MCLDYIASLIAFQINDIFLWGICPDAFKTVVIRPLLTKGDREKVTNQKPISLFTSFCKVFGNVLKERISIWINKHNLLSDRQYRFRQGRSTQNAIACLLTEICDAIGDNRPVIDAVFLDFAKAFDTFYICLVLKMSEQAKLFDHNK